MPLSAEAAAGHRTERECQRESSRSPTMATTLDNLIGMVMFPLIMLIGVAAFVSTMGAKGMEEMTVDDWISAVLAGSTVMVGGSFHVLPMNQGEAGTAAICILMPFGGLGVLGLREFGPQPSARRRAAVVRRSSCRSLSRRCA